MKAIGFEPVFGISGQILILGSFPSVQSRKNGFYYGNKQNRFWRTLAMAFGCELPTTNDEKRDLVISHGIALWDIVTECEIDGSQDSTIRNYKVADLNILPLGAIKKILCNGSTAYEIFAKNYPELLRIAKKMPSTSSANPRFDASIWQKELCER